MSNRPTRGAVSFSANLYRRLLFLYPARHRQAYGPVMVQLFRDQCRDAFDRENLAGVAKLWFRALFDLAMTSVQERIAAMKGNNVMLKTTWFGPRMAFAARFLTGFALVFLIANVVTFIQPILYCSTARVDLEAAGAKVGDNNPNLIQTQFERLQSKKVLYLVIEKLRLREKWGQRHGAANGSLTSQEAFVLLLKRLSLRQSRNTSLIEIRVYNEDPREAAEIANAVTQTYAETTAVRNGIRAEVIDLAEPAVRPVRPNVPLNLAAGVVLGVLVGMVCGLLARRTPGTGPPPAEPALPAAA